jgi:hypothetical protein
MRRIYFLLPDEHSAQTNVNELLLMRVEVAADLVA